jgi:tetratricopeptide (TPR) repeat protein
MTAIAVSSSLLEEAVALARSGRFDEAEAFTRNRLATDPHDAESLNMLGSIARARGQSAQAAEFYAEALHWNPSFAKARSNLGAVLLEAGRADDAIGHLRQALLSDPACLDARVNLGAAFVATGKYEDAERELKAALAVSPDDALARNTLGNALFHQRRLDEAVAAYEQAIAIEPTLVMALNNLGTAWREKGNWDKAEESLRRATTLDPRHAEAWSGLGVVLRERGRFDEALEAQNRALAIKPNFSPAQFSRGLLALGQGRFVDGFRDYLARPVPESGRLFRAELPQDLTGKRLLLLSDQGFGDELFFLRFAPALKRRQAKLIYRASPAIASIVSRLGLLDDVLAVDAPEPTCDFILSIGDLPHALGIGLVDGLPPPLALPALESEQSAVIAMLAQLGPPPYVGLTWRAGLREWNALQKAVPIDVWGRMLANLPATFLALQRDPDAGEIQALSGAIGAPLHDLSHLNRSLESMLAVLHRIDVYVGVSNTNTHLRAGTGKVAHVLVPHPPEWRWMNAGDRSPWFPSFPLYRQGVPDSAGSGWMDALARLRRDLDAFLRSSAIS